MENNIVIDKMTSGDAILLLVTIGWISLPVVFMIPGMLGLIVALITLVVITYDDTQEH